MPATKPCFLLRYVGLRVGQNGINITPAALVAKSIEPAFAVAL